MTVSDDLLVVAQPEALRFGLVEARHVAERAGLDQRGDDGGAERAGAAGDDDMTVAEIHRGYPLPSLAAASPAIEAVAAMISCAEGRISG